MSLPLKKLFGLLAVFLLMSPIRSFSAPRVELSGSFKGSINENLTYLVDLSGKRSIEDIRDAVDEFNPVPSNNFALNTQPMTVWLKLEIDNKSNKKRRVYLSFSPSYLGDITLYDQESLRPISQTGTLVQASRDTLSSELPMPVLLEPGRNRLLISMKGIGTVISVKLQDVKSFEKSRSTSEIVFFSLLGALSVLALYHLFISVTSRQKIYIYYVLYTVSIILFQLTITGFNRYFFPVSIWGFPVGYLGSLLTANIAVIFLLKFSSLLLSLKDKNRFYIYTTRTFMVISVLAVLHLLIFQSHISIPITRANAILSALALVTIGAVESIKKNRTAQFYLISWAPVLAGVMVLALSLSGVIESTPLTEWAMSIGSLLESLILSMAIGNRLERVTREKLEEQNLRIEAYKQIEENFERLKARDAIIRSYVSPTVLTELSLKQDPLSYQPRYLKRAILFADLRDFTTLAENDTLDTTYSVLNDFFGSLNSSIFDNSGEVDKLIGDAVMATFPRAQDCLNACLEFQHKLQALNDQRVRLGLPIIRAGLGLAYGEVLSANFGTSHKLDRTIVGDVVNLASRLEGLTKAYKVDVICSDDFRREISVDSITRPLDIVRVKGKTKQVTIHEIFGHLNESHCQLKNQQSKALSKAVELKKMGRLAEAIELLEQQLVKERSASSGKTVIDLTLQRIIESYREDLRHHTSDERLRPRESKNVGT